MKMAITAIERDGISFRSNVIILDVFEKVDDIVEACKEAAREYLTTKDGVQDYARNNESFNWGDFIMDVPNSICEKYGFRKEENDNPDIIVELDEQIAEPCFLVTNIEWDTDGESVDNLPNDYYIPFTEMMKDGETFDNIDIEEMKDRIADYLSDEIGWCVKSFTIN